MNLVYFIGIKGSGMSALAKILTKLNYKVIGSDITEKTFTDKQLEEYNIKILPFDCNNLKYKYDLIIKGNAFNKINNIEVKYLEDNKISYITYNDFLSQLCNKYYSIAVSGTHGKTTTTSLIKDILINEKKIVSLIGDGTGIVNSSEPEYFIFEACEYKNHFLSYKPKILIINNIEWDHPDFFKDIHHTIDSFKNLALQTNDKIICNGDNKNIINIIKELSNQKKFVTYGFDNNNDYIIKNYKEINQGIDFELYNKKSKEIQKYDLPFYGKYMALNATASIVVCNELSIKYEMIIKHLKNYSMVQRRFNIENYNNYILIDDYAHHPTEIKSTIASISHKYPNHKKVVIYQQHTFSRTKHFKNEYINSLKGADILYLTDVFSSPRESYDKNANKILLNCIPESGYLNKNNMEVLLPYKDHKYVILFMGAGDINLYIEKFKEIIKAG